ncbi:MAG: response regulator [Planctomycetota bacterium]|jgi:DNA-binding NtrC family response regulator
MVALHAQNVEYNVLASGANWAWPVALSELFKPRDVNLLVAEKTDDFVEIIRHRRVHTTIVDMDSESKALTTVKIIKMDYPFVPCILLSSKARQDFLSKALKLNVFSVIEKPVDMEILRQQLNRLFLKRYNSDIFRRIEINM